MDAVAKKGFDFGAGALVPADTAEVELFHPKTNEPIGVKVTVAGQDSERFRSMSAAQTNRRLQRASRGNRQPLTKEELERESLELLVHCTVAWEGVQEKGADVPFSPEKVREYFTKYPWMREQVDEAIGNRALFFRS